MEKRNEILELSLEFALNIIDYCELLEEKRKYVIARQLISSGTSIGANVNEAQNAESDADFIYKLKIAAKQADETGYLPELCTRSKHYPKPEKLTI
ncbi:MAG TPA: four helix bundle protein [Bacteroidales bacterium]|nr:four helix bundle protein [Bacteroidales bacterium]